MREIQSLTALRGFAAIWIVLHHFWPQTNSSTPYLISKGYLAVDLFFILSGVVLYLAYSDPLRLGQFDLKNFALKRFARLYPVHFVTLILATCILTLGPKFGFAGREIPYDLKQMFLLHITLMHAWGISETGGLNYPSWSLSAEAFAYALFPMLAVLTLKAKYALVWSLLFLIASIVLVQLFWPETLRNPGDNLVFTRLENDLGVLRIIPEFVLGLAIAKKTKSGPKNMVWLYFSIPLILIGFSLDLDALSVLGIAALIGAGVSLNPKIPRIFRHVGELSYCIYMTHALVQIVGFKLIEVIFIFDDDAVPIVYMIPLVGLTILIAQAMHTWCERPSRRWVLSLSKPRSAPPKASRSFPM